MTSLKTGLCLVTALVALAACSKSGGQSADDGDGGGTPPAAAAADSAASPAAAVAGNWTSPMAQKPGLWQVTATVGTHPAVVTKMCVDARMGENMAAMATNGSMPATDCSKKSVTPSATGADIAMTCTTSGRTVDSHIHVERVSDTEYHQTMDATFTPAVAGHDKVSSTTDGKWLGTCPADMKPGDMIMGTGIKVNMYDAMNKMKAMAPN